MVRIAFRFSWPPFSISSWRSLIAIIISRRNQVCKSCAYKNVLFVPFTLPELAFLPLEIEICNYQKTSTMSILIWIFYKQFLWRVPFYPSPLLISLDYQPNNRHEKHTSSHRHPNQETWLWKSKGHQPNRIPQHRLLGLLFSCHAAILRLLKSWHIYPCFKKSLLKFFNQWLCSLDSCKTGSLAKQRCYFSRYIRNFINK